MERHLRRSKYVGFLVISVGIILMVGAAVLPVGPASERFGPFQIDIRGDSCGPAGYVVYRGGNEFCESAATRRLLTTTGISLLVVALGMALYAGPSERGGSMVVVKPLARARRASLRSPGGRR